MKKNKRAARTLKISAAFLSSALPALGIAELDPTPAPKPTPKPTPPDKALTFFTSLCVVSTASSIVGHRFSL